MQTRVGYLLLLATTANPNSLPAQAGPPVGIAEQVQFESSDGVRLFGDPYRAERGTGGPVIILFHQAGSNVRGEYRDIVPRLIADGYSVLAVDLRMGGSRHGSENRTVLNGSLPESRAYCTAFPDVLAAWEYVVAQGFQGPRFAWGSSFSAALVIKLAAERPGGMSGVLAFSPASGEPMEGCRPESFLDDLSVPTLVLRPEAEAASESIAAQLERFAGAGHQTYVARPGAHGSSMLSPSRVPHGSEETWSVVLELLRRHSASK